MTRLTRRQFTSSVAGAVAGALLGDALGTARAAETAFKLRYILSSSMYGCTELEEILPEVRKTGTTAIDIWPKPHGNQREQLDAMGENRFAELLKQNQITLGCITQYKLGPLGLADEMPFAARFGCRLIVTGAVGPKGLAGKELRTAVAAFIEKLKPHLELAAKNDVTIAIENHANNLVESPDSLKWLAELRPSKHLAIALAPYHLPQEEKLLADLIRTLGDSIQMFYAWQHGMGCMTKLPKDQELLQMPGRGSLNFTLLLAALRDIHYQGWTSIFMHPVPRGIPILDTTAAVTDEINRSRQYLNQCLTNI